MNKRKNKKEDIKRGRVYIIIQDGNNKKRNKKIWLINNRYNFIF